MIKTIINFILNRNLTKKRDREELAKYIESNSTEKILTTLLKAMSLIFTLNKNFRKNIINFNARYLFNSKENSFVVSVIFRNNKMKVYKKEISETNVIITFKDAKALKKLILSQKPDILQAILTQDIVINGNPNYLYRFASMLNQLQLMAKGKM